MKYHVVCLDDLSSGSYRNIEPLLKSPDFEYRNQDVRDALNGNPALIFNFACPASPVVYRRDPIRTIQTNVEGAINVLELARLTNAVVVQASTSEVYGDPTPMSQREDYRGNVNPIGPRACYDEGKRCAETLFFDHRRQYGVRIKVARIFNTYGPRMQVDDGRVISTLICQALRNEEITIHGDGHQTRCFCFVDDLIDGILRIIETDDDFTGPVNLGSTESSSILELADRILELAGSRSRIRHVAPSQDDPRRRRPDVTLAKRALGWHAVTPLQDGLTRTIAYFDRVLSAVGPESGVAR